MKHISTFYSATLILFAFTANAFTVPILSTRSSNVVTFAVQEDTEKGVLGTTKDVASDAYSKTKDFVKDKAGNIKDAAIGAKD